MAKPRERCYLNGCTATASCDILDSSMQIDSSFFSGNRQALLKALPHSLIVLSAHCELQKSRDVAYPFEQENNFWYLTGINEPNWQLVIDGKKQKSYLVTPKLQESRALWDGALSAEDALRISGADNIVAHDELSGLLKKLQSQHRMVYTLLPQIELKQHFDFLLNPAPQLQTKQLKSTFKDVRDCRRELSKIRAIKQPVEIAMIQKAIDVSVEGIKRAMRDLPQYSYEYEFGAELSKQFLLHGGQGHAYDPIIAGGAHACTLHYKNNNAKLIKKTWLLFDVGARYERYCADISRTIPLGSPTQRQLAVYEAVKRVHDVAVSLLTPGQSVEDYYTQVEAAMGEELCRLDLIATPDAPEMRTFFPHAISHGLGLDVHDALGQAETFAEGMVLTVEPGIYIPKEQFGVRLENDIHITANGPVNLCKDLPNDIESLQRLVGA